MTSLRLFGQPHLTARWKNRRQENQMRNRNASRVLLTFVLALAVAVPFLTTRRVSAITGAIYTSKADGTTVNANIYDNCCDVYLNGGPSNCHGGSGLDDGHYYFQ